MIESRHLGSLGSVTHQEIPAAQKLAPTHTMTTTAPPRPRPLPTTTTTTTDPPTPPPTTATTTRRRRRTHVPHFLRPEDFVRKRNTRERCRVHGVNRAFDTLRQHVPKISGDDKAPKIAILRLASDYIMRLTSLLSARGSSSDPPLISSGDCWTAAAAAVERTNRPEETRSRVRLMAAERRMAAGRSTSSDAAATTQSASGYSISGPDTPRPEAPRGGRLADDFRRSSSERHCQEMLPRDCKMPPRGSEEPAGTFRTNPDEDLLSRGRRYYVASSASATSTFLRSSSEDAAETLRAAITRRSENVPKDAELMQRSAVLLSPQMTSPVSQTNHPAVSSAEDAAQTQQLRTIITPSPKNGPTDAELMQAYVISPPTSSVSQQQQQQQTSYAAFTAASSPAEETLHQRAATASSHRESAYMTLPPTSRVSSSAQHHRAVRTSPASRPRGATLPARSLRTGLAAAEHGQPSAASALRQPRRQKAQRSGRMATTTEDGRMRQGELSALLGGAVDTDGDGDDDEVAVSLKAQREFPRLHSAAPSQDQPKIVEVPLPCHPVPPTQNAALFFSSSSSSSSSSPGWMTSPHNVVTSLPGDETPSSYGVTSSTWPAYAETTSPCSGTLPPPKAGSVLGGIWQAYPESSHVIQPELRSSSANLSHWLYM